MGRRNCWTSCASCRACGRGQRPAKPGAAGLCSTSIATPPRASASPSQASTTRSTTHSVSASSRPSSRSRTSIASCWRSNPDFQRSRWRSTTSTSTSSTAHQVPLSAVATVSERNAPLNQPRPVPAATISFNLAPGASLGEAVTAIEQRPSGPRTARQRPDQLPGRGAGLSVLADQRAVADPRGRRHRCTSCWAFSMKATSTR